jgi:hypothetical protein
MFVTTVEGMSRNTSIAVEHTSGVQWARHTTNATAVESTGQGLQNGII